MDNETPNALPSYLTSLLRTLGGLLGGYLIGKGYITAEQAPEIGGGVLAVAVAVWGLVSKYRSHKALKAAIAAPAGQSS